MKKLSKEEIIKRAEKIINALKEFPSTDDGYYICTRKEIGEKTGLSTNKVARMFYLLEDKDVIKTEQSVGKYGSLLITGVKILKDVKELQKIL